MGRVVCVASVRFLMMILPVPRVRLRLNVATISWPISTSVASSGGLPATKEKDPPRGASRSRWKMLSPVVGEMVLVPTPGVLEPDV